MNQLPPIGPEWALLYPGYFVLIKYEGQEGWFRN